RQIGHGDVVQAEICARGGNGHAGVVEGRHGRIRQGDQGAVVPRHGDGRIADVEAQGIETDQGCIRRLNQQTVARHGGPAHHFLDGDVGGRVVTVERRDRIGELHVGGGVGGGQNEGQNIAGSGGRDTAGRDLQG